VLSLFTSLINPPIYVYNPLSGETTLTKVYKSYHVVIYDRTILADLIIMDMFGFNLILGMDWLTCHHTFPDYHRHIVSFNLDEKHYVSYRCDDDARLWYFCFLNSIEGSDLGSKISEIRVVC